MEIEIIIDFGRKTNRMQYTSQYTSRLRNARPARLGRQIAYGNNMNILIGNELITYRDSHTRWRMIAFHVDTAVVTICPSTPRHCLTRLSIEQAVPELAVNLEVSVRNFQVERIMSRNIPVKCKEM